MTTLDTTEFDRGGKDYFSLLPNEIIQEIFDEAIHSGSRARTTISKRLLPLVQASFYRRLYLGSLQSLSRLVRTIRDRPHLGSTTQEFVLWWLNFGKDSSCRLDPSQIHFLLSKFPRLRAFSSTHPVTLPSLIPIESISPNLRSVSMAVATDSREVVHLEGVVGWLSALPSLEELTIVDWHLYNPRQHIALPYKLDHVRSLKVYGGGVAEAELSILIDCFPQLEELSLVHENIFGLNQDFDDVLPSLTALFDRLKSLSISSDADDIYLGSSLANFTSLKHLRLRLPECYAELYESVLRLVNLESFDISCPNYSLDEILEIVEGPNRLLGLRTLKINQVYVRAGDRFNPYSSFDVSSFKERKYERFAYWNIDEIEWRISQFWSESELLIEVAEGAGIALEGSVLRARQVFLSYLLELNNLAIASAFFHRQYKEIPSARTKATRFGLELPELDFDSMDPDKLELVKVPVPELEWFALTLRDKVGESGIGGK